ncbi:MAG: hypothetical protein LBO66_12045 [Deltaproteobacteria bacterium]|jgi:hypothetical protein|nr:hypothetical protein [Deltaproteobacteria bacterium]
MAHKEYLPKTALLDLLVKRRPQYSASLVRLAGELILDSFRDALSHGRPIALRGFARFSPRRYPNKFPFKTMGLVFRPSPKLLARVSEAALRGVYDAPAAKNTAARGPAAKGLARKDPAAKDSAPKGPAAKDSAPK